MTTPPLLRDQARPLIQLADSDEPMPILDVDTLNVLTPMLLSGQDFETTWSHRDSAAYRFVRRGQELRAYVHLTGDPIAVEAEGALRAVLGDDEQEWSVCLRSPSPIVDLTRQIGPRLQAALSEQLAEGYHLPLLAEMRPTHQRVVAELHLDQAWQAARAARAGAQEQVRSLVRHLVTQAAGTVLN